MTNSSSFSLENFMIRVVAARTDTVRRAANGNGRTGYNLAVPRVKRLMSARPGTVGGGSRFVSGGQRDIKMDDILTKVVAAATPRGIVALVKAVIFPKSDIFDMINALAQRQAYPGESPVQAFTR